MKKGAWHVTIFQALSAAFQSCWSRPRQRVPSWVSEAFRRVHRGMMYSAPKALNIRFCRLNNGYRPSSTHTDEMRMARSDSFLKVSTEIIIKKVVCPL